jgi:3alpha(or 20beta)-hydroxysteroid dehydrogenase
MTGQGRLAGKVAIVTGAARGIGAATARLFAEEGAKVAIADVLDDAGAALAREIGDAAFYHHADASDEDDWRSLADAAETRFGPVDVLVNNAGVALFKTVIDTSKAEFERVIAINLTGVFLGMHTLAPRMVALGHGSIVNIASNEAMRGVNGLGAYAASKWGVRGLTKVAAMELGHRGVRVNSLHPGGTDTDLANPLRKSADELQPTYTIQPIQRIGRPREIAAVSLFLASDEASYVCGAEFTVDGGSSIGRYRGALPGKPDGAVGIV